MLIFYHITAGSARGKAKIMQKLNVINNWDKLPVVLDIPTVALIFNVTETTVKHWIYKGRLKGAQIGRKWIFDKEYIKSLVNNKGVI